MHNVVTNHSYLKKYKSIINFPIFKIISLKT